MAGISKICRVLARSLSSSPGSALGGVYRYPVILQFVLFPKRIVL